MLASDNGAYAMVMTHTDFGVVAIEVEHLTSAPDDEVADSVQVAIQSTSGALRVYSVWDSVNDQPAMLTTQQGPYGLRISRLLVESAPVQHLSQDGAGDDEVLETVRLEVWPLTA